MTDSVLITGGAGFIGSHLADRLLARGERVILFDNFDLYYAEETKRANIQAALAAGATLVTGDIRDAQALHSAMSDHSVGRVVHLAARPGVRPSLDDPAIYLDINVNGTLSVLEACRDLNVRRVVFASSSSVYGGTARPADEVTTPCLPLSPYGASKVAGEALCASFAQTGGLSIAALRFFTVYGPRQRPDMAINRFTRLILEGEPVPVFGDGTSKRDYTFISDTINGIVAALDDATPGYRVFNLGRGEPVVLRDLLLLLERVLGREARLEYMQGQPGDPQSTCADIRRAGELLDYEPQVSAVEGLRAYAEWYREGTRDRIGSR